MDNLLKDIRYAIRMLARNPGFTSVAVLALALGIGANTAIFSVVNAVLIRPLPFDDPDRLVVLWGNVQRQAVERRGASWADYLDWRAQTKSYDGIAASWSSTVTYYGDQPERLNGEIVGADYFRLLGIRPAIGSLLAGVDDKAGTGPGVLLGHDLWTRRFGSRTDVIGTAIRINQQSVPIVGVMPRGFRGYSDQAEVWLAASSQLRPQDMSNRGGRWFSALARLKPGVTREQAQAEITQISAALERAYPATNEKRGVEVATLSGEMTGNLRGALLVILAAVGVVLLIACANVANLLLAQAEKRQREIAIRLALGASQRRLGSQLITEGVVLSLSGAALGLAISQWGVDVLVAASPVQFPSFARVGLDFTVIAFTVAISLITGIALGLAPAFHTTASRVHDTLKESGGRSGSAHSQRFRNVLVIAEVALCVVLLVGAGLLIRSFQQLASLDPGFRPDHLLTLRVDLPRLAQPPAQNQAPGSPAQSPAIQSPSAEAAVTARMVVERLRSLPSVQSVALGNDIPLSGDSSAIFYSAEGHPIADAQTRPRAYLHRVSPGFFKTLGIPLVKGREFAENETEGVVVVSENVAKRFWPNEDPIGKRIGAGAPGQGPWFSIVGVVGETKFRALPRNPTADPDVYIPFSERARNFAIFVRTGMEPSSLIPAARAELSQLDRTLLVYGVATMQERMSRQMDRARFTSWLTGIFSASALLLALLGIYGVISYAVTRRTQEIGIRMALGASAQDVIRMVVRHGALLIGTGVLIGIALALGLTRLMETLLFGVHPADPLTYATTAALLIGVALFAAWLPARRATRIDPMNALRYE